MLVVSLGIIVVAVVAGLYLSRDMAEDGWVKVPRNVHEFDQLPGEEVLIRGYLEENDRTVLAIPKEGEPTLIADADVNRIVAEGLREAYDFREPDWTHRIRLEGIDIAPNFLIGGEGYYVIISSGTDVWRSENVLDQFADREVELIGKWDSFTDPAYPGLSVTQFQPKSIREAPSD